MAGCKKQTSIDADESATQQDGTVTVVGNPNGPIVTKTIGVEGGVLTSLDKNITLTIPAGAVATATPFSIQPIENFAPNGLGAAYRLLPEGTHFEKPIIVTFRCTDSLLAGSVPECLFIAYQGKDKIWKAQETTPDDAHKSVSATTDHFSDWSLLASFRLRVAKSFIEPNESTNLTVQEVHFDLRNLKSGNVDVVTTARNVSNWTLAGEGQLKSGGATATYTAPAKAPAMNPVTVSTDIDNILTNRGKKAKVMVLARITIGGEFMDVILGDVSYHITQCTTQMVAPYLLINALIPDMVGVVLNIPGTSVGWYPVQHKEGSAFISVALPGDVLYLDSYADCYPGTSGFTEASITITKMGNVGEYIEGWFGGEVVRDKGCGHEIKRVSGTFAIKRRS
ncbi:MAG TPA: hypothetical protein VM187_18520 [Niastella sp.]|nr:hypothetical protein [Niastella sp.]